MNVSNVTKALNDKPGDCLPSLVFPTSILLRCSIAEKLSGSVLTLENLRHHHTQVGMDVRPSANFPIGLLSDRR